jgi:hypothetical protein
MTEGDIAPGRYARRLAVMLALNFASVVAMTSPLWLTTAFRRAHTYWTIAVDPGATPQEVAAKMRRYRTPPLHEALWQDAALAALPYVAWVLVLHVVHRALLRPATRADRLAAWAAAGRFRLAYLLFWPIPFLTLLVLAFLDDCLRASLQPRGGMDRILREAWRWFVWVWLPTMPVLVGIGLFLAIRGVRRNIRQLRRRSAPAESRR